MGAILNVFSFSYLLFFFSASASAADLTSCIVARLSSILADNSPSASKFIIMQGSRLTVKLPNEESKPVLFLGRIAGSAGPSQEALYLFAELSSEPGKPESKVSRYHMVSGRSLHLLDRSGSRVEQSAVYGMPKVSTQNGLPNCDAHCLFNAVMVSHVRGTKNAATALIDSVEGRSKLLTELLGSVSRDDLPGRRTQENLEHHFFNKYGINFKKLSIIDHRDIRMPVVQHLKNGGIVVLSARGDYSAQPFELVEHFEVGGKLRSLSRKTDSEFRSDPNANGSHALLLAGIVEMPDGRPKIVVTDSNSRVPYLWDLNELSPEKLSVSSQSGIYLIETANHFVPATSLAQEGVRLGDRIRISGHATTEGTVVAAYDTKIVVLINTASRAYAKDIPRAEFMKNPSAFIEPKHVSWRAISIGAHELAPIIATGGEFKVLMSGAFGMHVFGKLTQVKRPGQPMHYEITQADGTSVRINPDKAGFGPKFSLADDRQTPEDLFPPGTMLEDWL